MERMAETIERVLTVSLAIAADRRLQALVALVVALALLAIHGDHAAAIRWGG
ncbi:MAG TPA: hypothetical protein VH482_21925 [Thermomicrobiales bacterium]|jgi:hypothetical protein